MKSMTGFGKASESTPYGIVTVEIKTLNNKSLSVVCAPFNGFFLLEEKITGLLEKKLHRGKVFVKIGRENLPGQKSFNKIHINKELAGEYVRKIRKTQSALKLPGEVSINDIISLNGVIESCSDKKEDKLWPYIRRAFVAALDQIVAYREAEGKRLAKDFKKRISRIKKGIKDVKKYEKECVADYRSRLHASIKAISPEAEIDKGRIETEVALFARNCDIAEEITRLEGHVIAYMEVIEDKRDTEVGKKLDFIAQEMQREVNTIGAKSSDLRVSECVIDMKSEIEKIREQIRNIE